MDFVINGLKGLLLGVTTFIPGLSISTIAVILNVYDRIIASVSVKGFRKNIRFLIPLGIGALIGLLAFSRFITYMYTQYRMITCFFFMGVILGSIPMIYRRARLDGVKPHNLLFLVLGFGGMVVSGILSGKTAEAAVLGTLTVGSVLLLVLVGMLVTFAMILPGVSGALVLMIFGLYATMTAAVSELRLAILLPFGVGCVIGFLVGAKCMTVLIGRYPQATYFAILGLVLGSFLPIYPGFSADKNGAIAIMTMIVGAVGIYLFSRKSA